MSAIDAFVEDAGWGSAVVDPIASDASDRRYARLRAGDGRTAILMQAPVATSDLAARQFDAFRKVSNWLRQRDLAAPEELSVDRERGFLLLEDLGDMPLSHLLESGDLSARLSYEAATDVLARLAEAEAPNWMAKPDARDMVSMVDLTFSLLPESQMLADQVRAALLDELAKLDANPVVSLRDVHGDNLIWRPDKDALRRIGLLDFQDALVMPDGYDLASLLDDPRRIVPEIWRDDLITRYAVARGTGRAEMARRVALLSLQRNLRILGIFRRLATERGRPSYARFLPRTRILLKRATDHRDLGKLRPLINELLDQTAHWQAEAA